MAIFAEKGSGVQCLYLLWILMQSISSVFVVTEFYIDTEFQSRPLYTEYASCVGPPKHQVAPYSQRCFHFSFVFEFGQWLLKTWMIVSFNAMRCHPLYVKISKIM